MNEAIRVNALLLAQDSLLCERGREMLNVGTMSRADLAQLEAQVSQGNYDLTNARMQMAEVRLQLTQLMNLPADTAFCPVTTRVAETSVLASLPAAKTVYERALQVRPEVKKSELAVEQADLQTQLAKAGRMPVISLNGGLGNSHLTGTDMGFGQQMRNNFNAQIGVNVTIPILDNRKTRSAVERAKLAETTAQIDLQDTRQTLYRTIETLTLNATTEQARYVAAKANVESLETGYDLMCEQFKAGLKNIAELQVSRASLITAKQTMLQNKYTALLYRDLLAFYAEGEM